MNFDSLKIFEDEDEDAPLAQLGLPESASELKNTHAEADLSATEKLLRDYQALKGDRSDIEAAQDAASSTRTRNTILSGLHTMAGGKDKSSFRDATEAGDAGVLAAEKQKAQELQDLLDAHKLKASSTPGRGTWQTKNIHDPVTGSTKVVWANTATKEVLPFDPGDLTQTATAGYALGFDSDTKERFSKSTPNAPSVPVLSEDGTPLADAAIEQAAKETAAREETKLIVDHGERLRRAKASETDFRTKKIPRWTSLYHDARAASAAGPGSGQWTNFKQRWGFSSDKAANVLSINLKTWANKYIKDTTGATMTDTEYRDRFMPIAPQVVDDPELFEAKMEGFLMELQDEAEKIRSERAAKDTAESQLTRSDVSSDPMPSDATPEEQALVERYKTEKYPNDSRAKILKRLRAAKQ